jgi:hypothetical protein
VAAVGLSDPNGVIITSLVASGVLGTVRYVSHGDVPPIRFGVGLVFSGLALSVMADFAPHLAAGLAVLMLVSSLFVGGSPVLDAITSAAGGTPPAASGGGGAERVKVRSLPELASAIVMVALVTTVVVYGVNAAEDISAIGSSFADVLRAAMGMDPKPKTRKATLTVKKSSGGGSTSW